MVPLYAARIEDLGRRVSLRAERSKNPVEAGAIRWEIRWR